MWLWLTGMWCGAVHPFPHFWHHFRAILNALSGKACLLSYTEQLVKLIKGRLMFFTVFYASLRSALSLAGMFPRFIEREKKKGGREKETERKPDDF